jgi:hypothetical protein
MLSFDSVVHITDGSVVNVYWCCWLWVSEFCKSKVEDFSLLSIEEESTLFSFRCGGSNKFEYCACDVDGTIKFDGVSINGEASEEEMPPAWLRAWGAER